MWAFVLSLQVLGGVTQKWIHDALLFYCGSDSLSMNARRNELGFSLAPQVVVWEFLRMAAGFTDAVQPYMCSRAEAELGQPDYFKTTVLLSQVGPSCWVTGRTATFSKHRSWLHNGMCRFITRSTSSLSEVIQPVCLAARAPAASCLKMYILRGPTNSWPGSYLMASIQWKPFP